MLYQLSWSVEENGDVVDTDAPCSSPLISRVFKYFFKKPFFLDLTLPVRVKIPNLDKDPRRGT